MEMSIKFNNAGVDCLEAGRHKVAWDLFKGALEIRLAAERRDQRKTGSGENEASNSQSKSSIASHAEELPRMNKYIIRAEEHYANLDSYLVLPSVAERSEPAEAVSFNNHSSSSASTRQQDSTSPSGGEAGLFRHQPHGVTDVQHSSQKKDDECCSSFEEPFLYRRAIRLQFVARERCDRLDPTSLLSRRESAAIIFNLAIVHHMKNRSSEQAVSLYELAMSLLTGDKVDCLGIALVNNMGVWCYENGDLDGAMTCMGHLSEFVRSGAVSDPCISAEDREGLHANIFWLMNRPFIASPAA